MANRLHLATPGRLRDGASPAGLASGEYFAQPFWSGQRAVVEADGSWHSGTGYGPRRRVPSRYRHLLVGLALEVRRPGGRQGRIEVVDVIIARPLVRRIELARAYGLELHAARVLGPDSLDIQLRRWANEPNCRGLVLKRESVPYPWLPCHSSCVVDWLVVDRPLFEHAAR